MTARLATPVLAALALLAGCSSTATEPAFGSVRDDVHARIDAEPAWHRHAPAGQPAPGVADLLAGELAPADCVRIALANNAGLQATFEELGVAHADVIAAGLLRNPALDLEVKFLESGGGEVFEFAIVQHLVGLVMMPLRKQVAAERYAQAEARVTAAALDLAGEVRTVYRRLQAQRQLADMLQRTVDATGYAWEAAKRLREAGNIRELDVLNERVLHDDARAALAAARVAALRLRERMNVLLGLWGPQGDAWTVPGRLPDPPDERIVPEEPVRRALERSLDLEILRREVVAVGHRIGMRRADALLPELGAGLAGEVEPDDTWSLGPAVQIPIPVFDRGRAASTKGAAELRRAYRRYAEAAVRLRSRVRDAHLVTEAARRRARFLRERVLPTRARITAQTQRQFNAMQLGVFALLQAKRAEIAAGRSYVETLRDYWVARTELDLLLAGRMPRSRFGAGSPVEAAGGGAEAMAAGGGGQGGH